MRLTVHDVAKMLNVSEKTVYRWIDQGVIPTYKVNNRYRFNQPELLEWAVSKKINVSQDLFCTKENDSQTMPLLADALEAGGIFYRVGGRDKESVLRSITQILRAPDSIDREMLFRVLMAREAFGSTGIGDGIAIPHVRNPIILHVSRPAVALCFLETPIDFGALDGKPVNIFFTMVCPTVRTHLHLLSRISFVLHDNGFRELLLKQGLREEIMAGVKRVEKSLRTTGDLNDKKE